MTSTWTKLKVVDLRAELKARGLPQTGLKPELVQRLTDDDAAAAETPAFEEPAAEGTTEVDGEPTTTEPVDHPESEPIQESAEAHEPATASQPPPIRTPSPQKDAPIAVTTPPKSPQVPPSQEPPVGDLPPPKPEEAPGAATTLPKIPQDPPSQEPATQDLSLPEATIPIDEPSATPTVPIDIALDAQKRKRRSSTPAPSAKRAKQAEEREDVVDFENSDIISASQQQDHNGVDRVNRDEMDVDEKEQEGQTISATADATVPSVHDTTTGQDQKEITGEEAYRLRVAIAESSRNAPRQPSETVPQVQQETTGEEVYRLRVAIAESSRITLQHTSETFPQYPSETYPPHERQEPPLQQREASPADDGPSVPSIHYATAALYIKNFMRPLKIPMVEDHIIALATPTGSDPDPTIIETFYLDQIRTHAFVVLQSTSAAARVRSALHDRVWPEESTRKPLWVDFVPPQKVQEWIDQEQSAGRGRFEVVYEQDDQGVIAVLQEAGPDIKPAFNPPTGPAARPRALSGANNAYPGIEAAPRGPRVMAAQSQRLNDSNAIWTRTTPPIRYQPVDEDLARRRIDNLNSFVSRDPDRELDRREINRYSYESRDSFIDRGKEQFVGIRPPPHVLRERRERDRLERQQATGSRGGFRSQPPFRPAVAEDRWRRNDDRGSRAGNNYRSGPSYRDFRDDRAPRGDRYFGGNGRHR